MNKIMSVENIIGAASVCLSAGLLAPAIIEKLNENEESKFSRIRNIIGVYTGCFAVGFIGGTLLSIDTKQTIFTEAAMKVAEAKSV